MVFPSSVNASRWRTGLWSGCWIALLATSVGCTQPSAPGGIVDAGSVPPTPSPTEPGPSPDAVVPDHHPAPAANGYAALGQQLPITAKVILGGEEIFLEVAETPAQQALGLMYRDALPPDRGMVFPMRRPRPVRFWMMNVPVALDMLFIYQGRVQAIAAAVPPCPVAPCPTYGPDQLLVDHVIELRAGRAAELGLQVGDPVDILPLE